jgi:hypothetical protein
MLAMKTSLHAPAMRSAHDATPPRSVDTDGVAWWGRIGLLWLLVVPLCVAIQAMLLPIGPNDFWYHARAGRFIVEHGFIPRENLFSESAPWVSRATPFYYQSWIAEIALFVLLRAGGLSAIIWARAACLALAFALLVAASWQRARLVSSLSPHASRLMSWDKAAKVACGAGLWALAMSNNNFDTRPQMFSVPLFAAWSLALWRWRFVGERTRRKYLLALWAALSLWVNVHGAFATAILTAGAYAVGAAFDAWRLRKSAPDEKATADSVARQSWILLAGALLATCLNPRGAEIFGYVRHLATLQAGQKYIQEWQAPEISLAEWNSLIFYAAPVAALALLLAARRKSPREGRTASTWQAVSGAEWAVALLLLVMAVRDKRSVLWFALWFAPLWASLSASLWAGRAASTRDNDPEATAPPRGLQVVNAAMAVLLCAAISLCAPGLKASFDWPPAFRTRFAPTPSGPFPRGFGHDPALLLDRATPVEAVAWLEKNPPQQRLWHDMAFGSYIMWAADGRIVPMCDPRVELYPDAFWNDYARLSLGSQDAAQVLARRGFSDALLDRKLQSALIRSLLRSGRWKIAFQSPPAILLRQAEISGR